MRSRDLFFFFMAILAGILTAIAMTIILYIVVQ